MGWDAVVGTVTVTDWIGAPAAPAGHASPPDYGQPTGSHPHVHGANLGFTAEAYLAAGGFPRLRTAEDHAMVTALGDTGSRILRSTELSVRTSARQRARAPTASATCWPAWPWPGRAEPRDGGPMNPVERVIRRLDATQWKVRPPCS